MALQMQKNKTSEGFMWAFSCPRFAHNEQAASDGTQDPKSFSIKSTKNQVPVTFGLGVLSGAKENC